MDDSEAQPAKADETKNDIEDGKPYLLKCLLNMGFTPQVAETICQSIPDELVDLQFPAYWAEIYLDEKADETMNDIEAGKPYLLKCLQNFGFTPQVADTICQSTPDELVDLQLPVYWAQRYCHDPIC